MIGSIAAAGPLGRFAGALGASALSGTGAALQASGAALQAAGSAASAVSVSAPGFAETMEAIARDTVHTLRHAEDRSLASIRGEATTREVVDALMSAEQTLQTAVAIRDKLVTAYLEIARMQI